MKSDVKRQHDQSFVASGVKVAYSCPSAHCELNELAFGRRGTIQNYSDEKV